MTAIEHYLQRILANPGMWVHIRKSKSQIDKRLKTEERKHIYDAIVTVLKATNIPHECGVRGYLIRTKKERS